MGIKIIPKKKNYGPRGQDDPREEGKPKKKIDRQKKVRKSLKNIRNKAIRDKKMEPILKGGKDPVMKSGGRVVRGMGAALKGGGSVTRK